MTEVRKESRRKKMGSLQSQYCVAGPRVIYLVLRNGKTHEMPEYECMLSSLDRLIFQ